MFDFEAIPAIFGRLTIFCQLNCSYPLVNHFQRTIFLNLFFKQGTTLDNMNQNTFKLMNVGISLVPLAFCLFYPNIGSVLGYAGALSGFFMIYLIPVMAYMKMRKLEIQFPQLAAALQENEVTCVIVPSKKNFPEENLSLEFDTGST